MDDQYLEPWSGTSGQRCIPESCVVLLSGGQDSTTCLWWAILKGARNILCLSMHYGQRHQVEILSAVLVAKAAREQYPDLSIRQEMVKLGPVLKGTSPLLAGGDPLGQYDNAGELPGGIEPTFVPGRNALFLVIAANRAHNLSQASGECAIVTGVCEEDSGGYPDCRLEFIRLMQIALSSGLYDGDGWRRLQIYTPLMRLTKRETVELANSMPGCMDALSVSHTCYNGSYPPCAKCHACILRQRGFDEAQILDPLIVRAQADDRLAGGVGHQGTNGETQGTSNV